MVYDLVTSRECEYFRFSLVYGLSDKPTIDKGIRIEGFVEGTDRGDDSVQLPVREALEFDFYHYVPRKYP